MIYGFLALFLFIVILFMVTLGAVLLARFVMRGSDRSARTMAAAIGGPLTLVLPVYALVLAEGDSRSNVDAGIGFIVLTVLLCLVGWPVAHFATRRLDKLTRFDPQVFE